MENLLFAGVGLGALISFIWLCVLFPASLAEERNRNQFGWALVAICGTPLLAVILLLSLGEKKETLVAKKAVRA
ncbi:hypothetical protein [Pseudooceanicola sp.]|uniref:hypothetical protein n=1 Tax=Pseudooceanicola sp. TaxID=1914328 RepID=UPI0035C76494